MKPRRLDQWLANLGYCSRSEAKAWIGRGRVTVDGKPARDPGLKTGAAAVLVDGQPLDRPEGILVMLHKPVGYVCSHSEEEGPSAYDLLPAQWRARNPEPASIGRLDKDTSGLLLVTDQTELIHRMTSPKRKVPKLYQVTVDRPLEESLIPRFASGTLLLKDDPEPCLPADLRIIGPLHAEVTLTEGRYHQVRRMFASQGWHVIALHRTRFGPYDLGELKPGQYVDVEQAAV